MTQYNIELEITVRHNTSWLILDVLYDEEKAYERYSEICENKLLTGDRRILKITKEVIEETGMN